MTDSDRRYARLQSVYYAAQITKHADAHRVPVRQEAYAALHASLEALYANGADDFDVANFVAELAPSPLGERNPS